MHQKRHICYFRKYRPISFKFAIQLHNWPIADFRTCGFPCGFLTSSYCDVTIAQLFDGPFDCDVIMKKSANMCDVGPLAIRQLEAIKDQLSFVSIGPEVTERFSYIIHCNFSSNIFETPSGIAMILGVVIWYVKLKHFAEACSHRSRRPEVTLKRQYFFKTP